MPRATTRGSVASPGGQGDSPECWPHAGVALFDGPQACSGVRCPALAPDLDGDQPGAAPDADLAGSGLAFGMSHTSQLLVDWLIHGGGPLQDEVWV